MAINNLMKMITNKRRLPSQPFHLANRRPSRRKVTFALFFALLSCNSFADWSQAGRTSEATVFFDQETIRRSGQFVKMWTLTNFTKSEKIKGKQFQSAKTQFEYDCIEERSRVLATTFYSLLNGLGVVTATESNIEQWYPIAPKTIAVKLWKYACGSLGESSPHKGLSEYIVAKAKIIGGDVELGMITKPVWDENTEVSVFLALPDKERVAAIAATIDYLQDNNDKLFNDPVDKKHRSQAKAAVLLFSFKYLHMLTKNTVHDHLLNEYITRDTSDLELVLRDKMSYSKYLLSREARFDHLLLKLMTDEEITSAYVNYKLTENNLPHSLANKTTIFSLINTCIAMTNVCTSK